MADKKIGVSLSFSADTAKAKTQIQELQKDLSNLVNSAANKSPLGFTESIKEATNDATKLQAALQKATSASTGKLDLNQFRTELNKAGLSADKISTSLKTLGPDGQATFLKLSQAITNAEVPLKRTNALLKEFATTLKNTVKWQLSSSITHGLVSSMQKAYYYAQDLNESLNSIRIVTGKSVDEMADFAKEANKAAKSLSTTTTAYTDASLIFFQQGLNGKDVTDRVDTVIKMANVTGQAADEVSSYMTAIWNNFADGSKNLEYYADVITALGASTASSSEEIAQGLEKFASIGDTVGLSYEYATSALAAVVAKTRQSADVIGNSFKTIFSRLQGLQLGETLEDGVDLNKYSKALETVGVKVIDLNGSLRKADDILEDTAKKWVTLDQTQKTALAQTVAGTRQYAQFVALMESWDDVQKNLNTASKAGGSLQEQADRFAESWEAARKRVKAAAQGIYDQLIDDEAIIKITDDVADLVEVLDNAIQSIGGLKGVLPIVANLMMKAFGPELAKSIDNARWNLENFSKQGIESTLTFRQGFSSTAQEVVGGGTVGSAAIVDASINQFAVQDAYIQKQRELLSLNQSLSEYDEIRVKMIQDSVTEANNRYVKEAQTLETLINEAEVLKDQSYFEAAISDDSTGVDLIDGYIKSVEAYSEINLLAEKATAALADGQELEESQIKDLREAFETLTAPIKDDTELIQKMRIAFEDWISSGGTDPKKLNALKGTLHDLKSEIGNIKRDLKGKIDDTALDELTKILEKVANQAGVTANAMTTVTKATKSGVEDISQMRERMATFGESVVSVSRGITSLSMGLNSLHNLSNIWDNEDLATEEKAFQIVTNLSMALPMLGSSYKELHKTLGSMIANKEINNSLDALSIKISGKKTKAKLKETATMAAAQLVLEANLSAEKREALLRELQIKGINKETLAKLASIGADKAKIVSIKKLNAALLTSPWFWVVAGITAATTALAIYIDHVKQTNKALSESAQESIDAEKAKQEELQANQELSKSYEDLYQQYKNGEIEKEALYEITDKLCEAYGIEGAAIAKLTGQYDGMAAAARRARAEALIEEETSAKRRLDKAKVKVGADFGVGTVVSETDVLDLSRSHNKIFDIGYTDANDEKSLKYLEGFDSFSISRSGAGVFSAANFSINDNSIEGIVAAYEDVQVALDKMEQDMSPSEINNSEVYQNLNNWLKDNAEAVKEYKEALEELESVNLKSTILNSGLEYANDYSNFQKIADKLTSEAENDENRDAILKYISSLNTKYSNYYSAIEELKNKIDSEGIKYLKGLSEEELSLVFSGKINFDFVRTKEDLKDAINLAENELNKEDFSIAVSLRDKLTSEKKLTKKQVQEATGEESALEKDYEVELYDFDNQSELEQVDILNGIIEDKIKANKKYVENYRQVKKEELEIAEKTYSEEKAEYDALSKRIADAQKASGGKLKISSILSEEEKNRYEELDDILPNLQSRIEDLQDEKFLNFELDNTIYDNMIAGIDSVITKTQALKEVTDSVGANWTIAKDKIFEMESAFPGLLSDQENYKILQDGSIQLTRQGVEEFKKQIALHQESLKQAQEEYKIEIQKQIDLHQATKEYYENQAQLLQDYLDGKATAADTEAQLKENVGKFEESVIKAIGEENAEAAQDYINNMKEQAEQNRQSTGEMYDDWMTLGTVIAAAAQAFETGQFNPGTTRPSGSNAIVGTVQNTIKDNRIGTAEGTVFENVEIEAIQNEIKNLQEAAKLEGNRIAELVDKQVGLQSDSNALENSIDNAVKGIGNEQKKQNQKQQKKEFKEYDDEFDRFYGLQKAVDDLNDTMSDLAKYQKHLFGGELISSLKKENKMLLQQKTNLEGLLGAQKAYRTELQQGLGEYGVRFGEITGNVTNYIATTSAELNKYNQAVANFNAGILDEEGFKAVEKSYEKFKKLLGNYKEVLTDIQDTENQIDDTYYATIENSLEAFEVEIKLNVDIHEAQRQVSTFLNTIDTNFKRIYRSTKEWLGLFKSSTFNANNFVEEMNNAADLKKRVEDVIADRNYDYTSYDSMFGSRSEALTKAIELEQAFIDRGEELWNLYNETWEGYLESIDQIGEQWNEILDNFDEIDEALSHYEKIIELIYGGTEVHRGREELKELYEMQKEASIAKQDSLKQEAEALQREREQLLAVGSKEGDKDLKKVDELIKDNASKLRNEIENYIEVIKKELENANALAKDVLDNSIWGKSFTDVNQEWEDAKEQAEGYYDVVERVYQLEQLGSKWTDLINDTSALKTQQQLTAMMDKQLEALSAKNELSEHDIALAEKELEVYKAQIALEEAQNNKNTMKLTRDASGNWTYQYVADDDDVASKQQDYLQKTNEWRSASIKASEDIAEVIQDAYEKFTERMTDIMNDVTLSEEERTEKMNNLIEMYYGKNGILTKNAEDFNYINQVANRATYEELWSLYNADITNKDLMTDIEAALVDEMNQNGILSYSNLRDYIIGDDGKSGVYGDINNFCKQINAESSASWKSMTADAIGMMYSNPDSVRNMVQKAYEEMIAALDVYTKSVKESEEASGVAWTNVKEAISKVGDEISSVTDKLSELIDQLDQLSEFRKYIEDIANAWQSVVDKIQDACDKLVEYNIMLAEPGDDTWNYVDEYDRSWFNGLNMPNVPQKLQTNLNKIPDDIKEKAKAFYLEAYEGVGADSDEIWDTTKYSPNEAIMYALGAAYMDPNTKSVDIRYNGKTYTLDDYDNLLGIDDDLKDFFFYNYKKTTDEEGNVNWVKGEETIYKSLYDKQAANASLASSRTNSKEYEEATIASAEADVEYWQYLLDASKKETGKEDSSIKKKLDLAQATTALLKAEQTSDVMMIYKAVNSYNDKELDVLLSELTEAKAKSEKYSEGTYHDTWTNKYQELLEEYTKKKSDAEYYDRTGWKELATAKTNYAEKKRQEELDRIAAEEAAKRAAAAAQRNENRTSSYDDRDSSYDDDDYSYSPTTGYGGKSDVVKGETQENKVQRESNITQVRQTNTTDRNAVNNTLNDLLHNTNPTYSAANEAELHDFYMETLGYVPARFATGGYTGEWNNGDADGKAAILHQKEIILNRTDTANFLEAIDMIRQMGSIDKFITNGIANMMGAISNSIGMNYNTSTTSEGGNIFNITAEFPNANSVAEIQEAILTLPTLASQYLSRI